MSKAIPAHGEAETPDRLAHRRHERGMLPGPFATKLTFEVAVGLPYRIEVW